MEEIILAALMTSVLIGCLSVIVSRAIIKMKVKNHIQNYKYPVCNKRCKLIEAAQNEVKAERDDKNNKLLSILNKVNEL